jgi:protein-tyrosine-phosphatase
LFLDGHRSSELTRELVEWADIVFAMTPGHLRQVHLLGGQGKAELLGRFGPGSHGGATSSDEAPPSVPDPFGGDDHIYEQTFLALRLYVKAALQWLTEEIEG